MFPALHKNRVVVREVEGELWVVDFPERGGCFGVAEGGELLWRNFGGCGTKFGGGK
jgi:hypothetical protein